MWQKSENETKEDNWRTFWFQTHFLKSKFWQFLWNKHASKPAWGLSFEKFYSKKWAQNFDLTPFKGRYFRLKRGQILTWHPVYASGMKNTLGHPWPPSALRVKLGFETLLNENCHQQDQWDFKLGPCTKRESDILSDIFIDIFLGILHSIHVHLQRQHLGTPGLEAI